MTTHYDYTLKTLLYNDTVSTASLRSVDDRKIMQYEMEESNSWPISRYDALLKWLR
jgi:hypothetical protein